jgi:hypothetical protein
MMRVQVMMVGMVQNFMKHFGTPRAAENTLPFQELIAPVFIGFQANLILKNRLFMPFQGVFNAKPGKFLPPDLLKCHLR